MRFPRFLTALVLILGAALPAFAAAPVAAVLQPWVDNHSLAGAVVLVASKEKVLDVETVGWSDVAGRKPMQPDSLFWIASMSKPMTAAALMMLVDAGNVALDAPVEKYLPEFHGQWHAADVGPGHMMLHPPDRPITVRDILSHTSGLPFMSSIERKIDGRSLAEAAISYALTPLRSQPGLAYSYSNAGINTAGRIIEVVGGMPYEKFMEERLFRPLGMKDTTLRPSRSQLRRLAKSYKPDPAGKGLTETPIEQLSYPLDDPRRAPCPAGGYFSTAADVAKFCRMILNGGELDGKRYLSISAIREMTSTQTGRILDRELGQRGYGLGWNTTHQAAGGLQGAMAGIAGHGGAYATQMWVDPEHGIVTVYMVQHAAFAGVDGNAIHRDFTKAAIETFGRKPGAPGSHP